MSLPPDNTIDDVIVKIRESYSNPSVGKIQTVILKSGPQVYKVAALMEIIDRKTGDFHHYSLKIDHIKKTKAGWDAKPAQSVRLEGKDPDEIDALYRFLHVGLNDQKDDKTEGTLHVVRDQDFHKLSSLLNAFPSLPSSDKLSLVKTLIDQLGESETEIQEYVDVLDDVNVGALRHFAAASRYLQYREAYEKLENLVANESTLEPALQNHLQENPWMFGSEYSKLIPRRSWTRDENLDFMLRRTVDGYLEIIEIKRAIKKPLFIYDKSHDSFYPSADLSEVLGQTLKYIEEVERNRDTILAKDRHDTLKITAKIIVGRDSDERHRSALRNLNDNLHSIEIITYDQLIRIAKRILSMFYEDGVGSSENLQLSEFDDDIPF